MGAPEADACLQHDCHGRVAGGVRLFPISIGVKGGYKGEASLALVGILYAQGEEQ